MDSEPLFAMAQRRTPKTRHPVDKPAPFIVKEADTLGPRDDVRPLFLMGHHIGILMDARSFVDGGQGIRDLNVHALGSGFGAETVTRIGSVGKGRCRRGFMPLRH